MNFTVSDEALGALGEAIGAIPGVNAVEVAHGELNVLAEASRIVDLLKALRERPELNFQQLIDLCGVDYPERTSRFDVVYHLLSLTHNRRVRIKVQTDEASAVPTVTSVYPCADWYEREAFDMYGIYFEDHPDLRRLLTDYGFQGHPLRKDFPMTGYVEVRYDDELKRVVYEPVKITEFRAFDFLSPWEGAQYALPGDEKAEAKK
jgi:NADH-quinone oxidoreductase subunit C